MSVFVKKSISQLLASSEEKSLKRTLGAGSLIALGIGAIIGAGLLLERLPPLVALPVLP